MCPSRAIKQQIFIVSCHILISTPPEDINEVRGMPAANAQRRKYCQGPHRGDAWQIIRLVKWGAESEIQDYRTGKLLSMRSAAASG